MKTFLKAIIIAIPLLASPTVWAYNTNIETGVGRGEWGNTDRTYNVYTEARIGIHENVYVYARGELNDHPVEDVKDEAYLGMGLQVDAFGVELAGNDDRFYGSLYWYKQFELYEVKGSLYHSNNYSQGFSRTGLKSQAGLRLTKNITAGVFYQIGNVTRDITDDSYGLYLRVGL